MNRLQTIPWALVNWKKFPQDPTIRFGFYLRQNRPPQWTLHHGWYDCRGKRKGARRNPRGHS